MSYRLATSLSDVDTFLFGTHHGKFMGMDTEATSLDTRRAKLTGISMAWAPDEAIYIPLAHKVGSNLPFVPVWERITECLEKDVTPIFFNAKYDMTVLEVATKLKGLKPPKTYGDALELVYLADPDRKVKNLKEVCGKDLGFNMEKFEELFTDAEVRSGVMDISTKSPARCANYAAADADGALRVWEHFHWVTKEFSMATKIDHLLIDIVRKMEHNGGLILNHEYIDEQLKALDARADALREQIHRLAGYSFEINSPKQLGIALFDRMGIPPKGKTKGKNPIYITSEDVLDKLRIGHPIVELIINYKKVVKAKSSYFLKLKRLDVLGKKPRFNFNMFSAPTFRFSAPGGDPEKDGATGVNIQAVSDGEAREILGVDLKIAPEGEDYTSGVAAEEILIDLRQELKGAEDNLPLVKWEDQNFPYVVPAERLTDSEARFVCFRESCLNCPAHCQMRGIDITRRLQKGVQMIPSVRQSFRAPPGWKLVSFDYDRQELVIGANMSQEPRWLRALAANEDLHAMTAAAAFGMSIEAFKQLPEAEQKRKRDIGKTLNFAIFYGATSYTLANKADISQMAADQIYDGFVKGHPVLMGWIQKVHVFAKKNGYTTTYFGRKRWLKSMYADPRPYMQAFANRSAVNTAIQGTAAEVTRIAMVKVEKRLRDTGYSWGEVAFALQIHDELAFLVRNQLVREVVPLIKDSMEFKVKSWQVQLSVSPKMGDVWGQQKKITLDKLAAGEYNKQLEQAA